MTRKTKTSTNGVPAKNALILLAAGSSMRMGNFGKKEFLPLNGSTVLSTAAAVFLRTKMFSIIAVAHPKGELKATKAAFYSDPAIIGLTKNLSVLFVQGGDTRQKSVLNCLQAIKRLSLKHGVPKQKGVPSTHEPQTVLIHDGARPFLSSALVLQTLKATAKYGAAVPALEPVETQKEIDGKKNIVRHLQRKNLASVQTPQGFNFEKILQYHIAAKKDRRAANALHGKNATEYTDDTEIWDNYAPTKTHVIKGESANIKITYPKDLTVNKEQKSVAKSKKCSPSINNNFANNKIEVQFRVGIGYDLHRLVEGRKLILGGVHIPSPKGELGHSDGDALLHAITDALLGAAALGDIGSYFPDTDKKWLNADSKKLLAAAWNDVKNADWQLENLDCVVKLQKPKFLPYRERVCKSIAKILGVPQERVFVKAKTGEGLGDIGNCNAIECQAICLLKKDSSLCSE